MTSSHWTASLRRRLTPSGADIRSDDFAAAREAVLKKFVHDQFSLKVVNDFTLHLLFSFLIIYEIEHLTGAFLGYLYIAQAVPVVMHAAIALLYFKIPESRLSVEKYQLISDLIFLWIILFHIYAFVAYFEKLPTSLIFLYFYGLTAAVFGAIDQRPLSIVAPIVFPLIVTMPAATVFIWYGDDYLRIFGVCIAVFYFYYVFGSIDARSLFVETVLGRIRQDRTNRQLEQANADLERARREVQESLASRTRFFAAVSHDLRQPLHALGLLSEVLKSADAADFRADLAPKIAASLRGVEGLLAEMLDLSRLDARQVTPEIRAVRVAELFDEAESVWSEAAERIGVELRVAPTSLWIRTDPSLFTRVLGNFVANALEHASGGGKILVGLRRRGAVARVVVYDRGPGVPAAERERIFEEFVAREGRRASGQRGLGLGLAIARRVAALLDHPIGCDSEVGRGSAFWIEAPLAAPVAAPARLATGLDGLRLLIIEDDETAAAAMRRLLESWGCVAAVAESGSDALAQAVGFDPAIVIADYELGDGPNGLDAVREIRRALGRDVPAALVTGSASELGEERRAGDPPVLLKPVKPAQLRALVAALRDRPAASG